VAIRFLDLDQRELGMRHHFALGAGGNSRQEITDVENSSGRNDRTLPYCMPDCPRANLANLPNLFCDSGPAKCSRPEYADGHEG